jgi:hypothetical protein
MFCYGGAASLLRHRLRKIVAFGAGATSWGFTPAALLGATITVCRTQQPLQVLCNN